MPVRLRQGCRRDTRGRAARRPGHPLHFRALTTLRSRLNCCRATNVVNGANGAPARSAVSHRGSPGTPPRRTRHHQNTVSPEHGVAGVELPSAAQVGASPRPCRCACRSSGVLRRTCGGVNGGDRADHCVEVLETLRAPPGATRRAGGRSGPSRSPSARARRTARTSNQSVSPRQRLHAPPSASPRVRAGRRRASSVASRCMNCSSRPGGIGGSRAARYRPSALTRAAAGSYRVGMDVNEFEARAHALVTDGTLGYDQKLRRLASLATEMLPYPILSTECQEALDERVICDMFEGNAPFTARYILPDYEKAIRNGLTHLEMPPPTDARRRARVPADHVRERPQRDHLPGVPRRPRQGARTVRRPTRSATTQLDAAAASLLDRHRPHAARRVRAPRTSARTTAASLAPSSASSARCARRCRTSR